MMKQEIDLQQRSILYENYVARQVFGVRGVFASAPVDFFFYYTYSFFFFLMFRSSLVYYHELNISV